MYLYFTVRDKKYEMLLDDDNVINEINGILMKKIGIYLDPYSDKKFYPSHLEIIVNLLKNYPEKKYQNLKNFLEIAIKNDVLLYSFGD